MNILDIVWIGSGPLLGWVASRRIPASHPRTLFAMIWLLKQSALQGYVIFVRSKLGRGRYRFSGRWISPLCAPPRNLVPDPVGVHAGIGVHRHREMLFLRC